MNNGFYDTGVGYSSYPPDIIDVTDHYLELLDGISNQGKRIVINNGVPSLVDRDVMPLTWDDIRKKRDDLLALSDWTQLSDAPVDQTAWATYRKVLRDIPQSYANPADVVFPGTP
jgi:hypothetical protein